ncbi:hypothetical protein [Bacillus pretiosus]|uniref:hypothetical protein n=1 Tax=Bacillus pretiosus TaxID=2983392 RepID=UPI003D64880A
MDDFGLKHYINLQNHAKIIITDTYSYIGSANFSEGTKNSIEAGLIINSKELSKKLWDDVVPYYSKHENSIYLGDYKVLKKLMEDINKYIVQLDNYINELEILKQDILMDKRIKYSPNKFVEIFELLYNIEQEGLENSYYNLNGKIDSIDDGNDSYNQFYDSRCQAEEGSFLYNQAYKGEIDFGDLDRFVDDLNRDRNYLKQMYLEIKNRVEKLDANIFAL